MRGKGRGMRTVQRVNAPEPEAKITTRSSVRAKRAKKPVEKDPAAEAVVSMFDSMETPHERYERVIARLRSFVEQKGDISELLDGATVSAVGIRAIREWRIDEGSRADWLEQAERGLALAEQENPDSEDGGAKTYPWVDASDVNYPMLTTACNEWAARAYPELVKGDKVVGVKTFNPKAPSPSPAEQAQAAPPPQDPQGAQQAQQAQQNASLLGTQQDNEAKAKDARGNRVAAYLNWLIFYKMDGWEKDTDLNLHQLPATGSGFKKVRFGDRGLQSDFVSPLHLTVAKHTKSMHRCPRITEDYEIYPYEINEGRRSGRYRDVVLPVTSSDPENPRLWIEQYRYEDLDEDGYPEPYIVTVDVQTNQTMRIEPAFGLADIIVNDVEKRLLRIERWQPFADFEFLPNKKGGFYGTGFAKLLESITDSIDTSINQLMDAGTAEIAGGGFIGSQLRIGGSGQGGAVYFSPGEYQVAGMAGGDIREAIYERTTPHPSDVTFKLLELLLAAAKDISHVKDVVTGNADNTAPVGTTFALQDAAMSGFSAIYKRVYRGFTAEFQLMYECLRRFAGAREKAEYLELTGGDFDVDFAEDATAIRPVADPTVVTKVQKVARLQTLMQVAESPIGAAAGMQQPDKAQAIAQEALEIMDYDRPERFIGQVQPNPMDAATVALTQAETQYKAAQAEAAKAGAVLDNAKTTREMALAQDDTLQNHVNADRIAKHGLQAPPEGLNDDASGAPPSAAPNA